MIVEPNRQLVFISGTGPLVTGFTMCASRAGSRVARIGEASTAVDSLGDDFFSLDYSDSDQWLQVCDWMAELMGQPLGTAASVERVVFVHDVSNTQPVVVDGGLELETYSASVMANSVVATVLAAGFLASANKRGVPGLLLLAGPACRDSAMFGWSSYCAAKAALDFWVQAVALELDHRGSNLKVCAIAPGFIDDHAVAGEMGSVYWQLCQSDLIAQGQVGLIGDFLDALSGGY